MELTFRAHDEDSPAERWRAHFTRVWPGYQEWFLKDGTRARPTFLACEQALERHLPELAPVWRRLCELAGGGDVASRCLSLWCPPPFFGACSQAVTGGVLVRNYDYAAPLCEAVLWKTCWLRPVIAMGDCLWGALDGINDAGLAASLSFGGRPEVGEGFGIPLVVRYLLECCTTVPECRAVLQRVPVHMSYNLTLLDAHGDFVTAYLAPDRAPVLRAWPCATNHQGKVEWAAHAEVTGTVEREAFLADRLADPTEDTERLVDRFAEAPLFWRGYARGWGTLYTSVYRPAERRMELRWPDERWRVGFTELVERTHTVRYPLD
ncbi:MAG: hypothetical protein HYS27_11375 [Deltaproteobacteria bacterium]|nr:hypothetical protein [Deltaproteobacteria bacterium]